LEVTADMPGLMQFK